MVVVVSHGDGLLKTLGLVVAAAGTDGVHVAVILLHLRVNFGVAVHFRSTGNQHAGPFHAGQSQQVVGAQRAHLQGLNRNLEVVNRRGRRGEVQNVIQLAGHEHKFAHVGMMELKIFLAKQMLNILERTRNQVVHGDDVVALFQEPVAEVRAQKTGPAGNEDAFFFFGSIVGHAVIYGRHVERSRDSLLEKLVIAPREMLRLRSA